MPSPENNKSHKYISEIDSLNAKLSKARDFFLEGSIDAADYKLMKADCEAKIQKLEALLTEQASNAKIAVNLEVQLDKAINALRKLDVLFSSENGDVEKKRIMISSIYPEKLCFDGNQYRTPRTNEIVKAIFLTNNRLKDKKNRNADDILQHSGEVVLTRIEPLR